MGKKNRSGSFVSIALLIAILLIILAACASAGNTRNQKEVTSKSITGLASRQPSPDEGKNVNTGVSSVPDAKEVAEVGEKTNNIESPSNGPAQVTSQSEAHEENASTAANSSSDTKEKIKDVTENSTLAKADESKGKTETSAAHISITGPKDKGIILADTIVNIAEGDTVIDVLKRVTKQYKIQMEYSGIKSMAYVKGIKNIYEFDYGSKSGWIYRVNRKVLNVGAGAYTVKDGDVIEWLYTVDLGKEFGAEVGGK